MNNLDFINNVIKYSDSKVGNRILLNKMDKFLYKEVVTNRKPDKLLNVQQKKYEYVSAMLHRSLENVKKGYFSKEILNHIANTLIKESFLKEDNKMKIAKDSFYERNNFHAPNFLVLSPSQYCNLQCTGCYANSSNRKSNTLTFEIVEKICDEVINNFGVRFITISGGEPLLYKDENGKTIFDLFEKYNNIYFLMYTNGTLINKENAERLRELKNVTPAISVEGLEENTDNRRGKGVYKQILKAFENLRNVGVPFGISVTATSKNIDELLSDDFYKFYFDEQRVTYMWQFQFLPIGRGNDTFEAMVTPEDRLKLYRVWEKQLTENKYCIADFWNSGMLTSGCIAYGGNNGYFYIDWNGNIMPCVFIPFSVDNVYDLYKNDKTIEDALKSDFMTRGREWQEKYKQDNSKGNMLMPCSFRDHYDHFYNNVRTDGIKGEDSIAEEIIKSKEYYDRLTNYDKELHELTDPIWKDEYLKD